MLHPQDYWINVNLANCLLRLGPEHLDDAIRYYTAAVALRPEAALSHSNLGNALVAKGLLDEAIAECRQAIRVKKDTPQAHANLGSALRRKSLLDEISSRWALSNLFQIFYLGVPKSKDSHRKRVEPDGLLLPVNFSCWHLSFLPVASSPPGEYSRCRLTVSGSFRGLGP